MRFFFFSILATAFLFLASCDQMPFTNKTRYEIFIEKDGIIRLNKETGEILIVSNNGELFNINEAKIDKSPTEVVEIKDFGFPGSKQMWGKLAYKWKNGQLMFRYEFGPYVESFHKSLYETNPEFTLIFTDKDFFTIVDKTISFWNQSNKITRIVGIEGEPSYLSYENSIECDKHDFLGVKNESYTWSYTDEFRQVLKEVDQKIEEQNAGLKNSIDEKTNNISEDEIKKTKEG
jgi:hypothetical protein